MSFSIRLTKQEKDIANSYAKLHSLSLGEAFKQALFEKIEDEYDIAVFDESLEKYRENNCNSRPIAELWRELDL